MSVTDEQGDRSPLSPEESLALIERTRAETRRALGWSGWVFYAAWGAVWLVCYGITHLVVAGPDAPLASWDAGEVSLIWLTGLAVGFGVTITQVSRQTRGLQGHWSQMGWRIGVAWTGVFSAAGALTNVLDLPPAYAGVIYVLVIGVAYAGAGALLLDDVQLWLGIWLLTVVCVGVGLGPGVVNALFALLGGGGFLVAAVLDRARLRRGDG